MRAGVEHNTGEERVAAAPDQALDVGDLGLHPLLLVEAGATDRFLLGELLENATPDEGVERFNHHEHLVDLEAKAVDRAEHSLVAPGRLWSEITQAGARGGHPGVAQGERAQSVSERAQVLAPAPANLELQVVAHHRVDHQFDQLVFAGDVPVQRCRSNPSSTAMARIETASIPCVSASFTAAVVISSRECEGAGPRAARWDVPR